MTFKWFLLWQIKLECMFPERTFNLVGYPQKEATYKQVFKDPALQANIRLGKRCLTRVYTQLIFSYRHCQMGITFHDFSSGLNFGKLSQSAYSRNNFYPRQISASSTKMLPIGRSLKILHYKQILDLANDACRQCTLSSFFHSVIVK